MHFCRMFVAFFQDFGFMFTGLLVFSARLPVTFTRVLGIFYRIWGNFYMMLGGICTGFLAIFT